MRESGLNGPLSSFEGAAMTDAGGPVALGRFGMQVDAADDSDVPPTGTVSGCAPRHT